ncbi:MAG TPA: carboxypeptidase regulatory-like domain-containing protein, partial [Terriglobia bacterium]|nr:carboxypeptidase regulatory-like domain-containing protein [Terriglobia bacterium]
MEQLRNGLISWRTLVLAAILFGPPGVTGVLVAQAPSGTLRGQLTDPAGLAVTQGTISVTSASGQAITANPDKGGAYQVKGLAPGLYTVKVTALGFAAYEQPSVQIAAGQTHQLDIALKLEEQVQQVTVTGEAAKVDVAPENNASAVVIKGKDLDALSDDPDELESELQALAGPSTGPNGGQIYIDGFTGGQLPPKADIREIRVNQNPFSAEYDRLGYGRIEILTKPGTDKLHGRVMGDFNDSAFNSRNPFAQQVPSYHSEFFDGNLGGPLSKKASFFLDGQRRDIQDASVVSAVVLDSNLNQTPFSQAVLTPQTRTNLSPRVDYQLGANNTLTVRYQYWHNSQNNQGIGQFALPSLAYNALSTEHTLQVSDSQVISIRTVNDTRFQYRHVGNDQTPASTDPTLNVLGAFTSGGSSGGTIGLSEDSYELQNYTSMALGKHFIRFGGRLRDDDQASSATTGFNGTFTFSSLAAYQLTEQGLQQGLTPAQIRAAGGGASQFGIESGNPLVRVRYLDFEPYAEDDVRLRPNLTLSLGLRFETQDHINDHADVAPRLGLAWGVGGGKGSSPKTVVRAGFGIFYDRFTEDLVLQADRLNGVNQQQFVVTSPDFFPAIPPPITLAAYATLPTAYQIDPNLRAPYTVQTALGVERQLFRNATMSVTYLNAHGVHQLLSRDINAPLP